jgi:hypothetical protein
MVRNMDKYLIVLCVENLMTSTIVMWMLYMKGTPTVEIGIGGALFSSVIAVIFIPKFWLDETHEEEKS